MYGRKQQRKTMEMKSRISLGRTSSSMAHIAKHRVSVRNVTEDSSILGNKRKKSSSMMNIQEFSDDKMKTMLKRRASLIRHTEDMLKEKGFGVIKNEKTAAQRLKTITDREEKRRSVHSTNSFGLVGFIKSKARALRKILQQRRLTPLLGEVDSEQEIDMDKQVRETALETFRRSAAVVRRLCSVCIALRHYARAAGYLENYMVDVVKAKQTWQDVNNQRFNPREYMRNTLSTVPHFAVNLLKKEPYERTEMEKKAIARVLSSMNSFRKYTTDMQLCLAGLVRYMRCGKRRVVLRKGHAGHNLYFIFSGSVNVVFTEREENISALERRNVISLVKGECFGEIALLENTVRTATIICAEDCEFFFIEKHDFRRHGLHVKMKEEFEYRFHFFRNWPAFSLWPDEFIKKLTFISRLQSIADNKLVIEDVAATDELWFVLEGSCDLVSAIGRKRNRGVVTPLSVHDSETVIAEKTLVRPMSAPLRGPSRAEERRPTSHVAPDAFDCSRPPSRPDEDKKTEQVVFMRLDTFRHGAVLGHDILVNGRRPEYSNTSLVSRGCMLCHMPRERFVQTAGEYLNHSVKLMGDLIREYPREEELRQRYQRIVGWERYKVQALQTALGRTNVRQAFNDTLRNNRETVAVPLRYSRHVATVCVSDRQQAKS